MRSLSAVVDALDDLFALSSANPDPAFSRFVPMAYEANGTDWRARFEPGFVDRFNGLMLRGGDAVERVYLAAFPSVEALDVILAEARSGDLIFSHHPIDMRCGDPRGKWGCGFVSIPEDRLNALRDRGISFYSCHAPMDTHRRIGTTAALTEALGGSYVGGFMPYGGGFAGAVCDIGPLSGADLAERFRRLLGVPYLHTEGPAHDRIERIAIVPGCGDHVPSMRVAAEMGAQAYLTGEVHCHIDNDYGRSRMAEMKAYIAETPMTLLGGSHAASEFLVMRTQMKPWFESLGLEPHLIEEDSWWR